MLIGAVVMVVNAILSLFGSAIAAILGLIPHLSPPAWLSSVGSSLAVVTGALSGSTAWLPWSFLELGIALSLAGVGLAVAVRGFRIVASFLTLGGGS